MEKLKDISYVPVLNGSILNCVLRDDMYIDGKLPTFYTKNGIFKHNTYLINPYHHADIFKKIKEKNMLLDDSIIIADSGGLQEITQRNIKYSPEEVFKWQQKHTHIGFSVDCLPFIVPGEDTVAPGSMSGWIFDEKNFLDYARKSKDNIEVTKPYRDREKYPDFSFYGIIQGRTYAEYQEWYNVIRDDKYLDGYCCKAPNMNPMTIAETCVFAIHNLVKPVHFLGIGNLSRSIIIYYANKYIKQPITFDSSSYDIGTQYRSYLLPFMINRKLRFVSEHNMGDDSEICNQDDVVYYENANDLCDCAVCTAIGDKLGTMIKENDPKLGGLISVHNLILNVRWNNYVKGIINKPKKLKEFVKCNFEESLAVKILNGFDMIDLSVERGPEYALHKYKDSMGKNKSVGNQKGLIDY